ncbi:MAG: hypothetical protein HUJ61_06780, partial [Bacilli bacterium]|nr:hypothetical protein [Bacilli bacterium]
MKLILSTLLVFNFFNPYLIEIPKNIEIDETGEIEIKVNNIDEDEIIYVNFDDSFTLNDDYGKEDINASILNNNLVFNTNNSKDKITYTINNLSAGSWKGIINFNIIHERIAKTNTLIP